MRVGDLVRSGFTAQLQASFHSLIDTRGSQRKAPSHMPTHCRHR